MAPGNKHFLDAVANLFGSEKGSDCVIRFYQEADVLARPKKKHKANKAGAADALEGEVFLGTPLPAHRFVLCYSSERFSAQLERWDNGEQAPPAPSARPSTSSTTPSSSRPELRIPLASEAEVDSARAAIRFAYTGEVQAGSVREVLEVRRQAAYLQIEGCAKACDEVLCAMMAAAATAQQPSDRRGSGAAVQGDPGQQQAAVLDVYASSSLWPDAGFETVITAAKQQLVSYFGSTLRVLNTPPLRQQLLALPAVAVEALLESDSFGTDSESSVLLMLAVWMQANHGKTDAAVRERLCRRVRLVQLSKPYLSFVLPALAADYEVSPDTPAGWFPITMPEAAFIAHFAGASDIDRKRLLEEAEKVSSTYNIRSATYSTAPRVQCVPREGLTMTGYLPQRELEEKLASLQPGEAAGFFWTMKQPVVSAQGFEWRIYTNYLHGESSAGLYLHCYKPEAYRTLNPRRFTANVPMLVSICGRLAVNRWRNGARAGSFSHIYSMGGLLGTGQAWGNTSAMPLKQLERGAEAGDGGGDAAAGGDREAAGGNQQVLAAWGEYLHEGKITGSLTLLSTAGVR
ncbi:hypothetical protein Agub_g9529 [Astrephomene gubernaculifera]|uniref:BACK domain-containing protein n=1 Tax=Astrephomene gubernaculifera TaxID=47775 RepID=A0AAD3DV96_9CHLO|nr:hypothetical protein Agub_g9529 [Astrephomene gubernaculifera]